MKKYVLLLLTVTILSCQSEKKEKNDVVKTIAKDSTATNVEDVDSEVKMHSNEGFRNVLVQSLGNYKYQVKGQARVFEATINWSVEDGHYILTDGFATADLGAPEWGNFEFEFTAKKADENTNLVLVLFESSAKDGSHLHELPIVLN